MLKGIEFKDKRFKTKDDYNVLGELTENTIILCNNYKLLDTLGNEILNTVNGKAEYNNYLCDDEDVGKAKVERHGKMGKMLCIRLSVMEDMAAIMVNGWI